MYLRTTAVKKGDKAYRYAQLVRSRRRKSDGVVVKDVIANLGRLDDEEIANLRAALEASRRHERVVLAQVSSQPPPKPHQSLRYLTVAVFLELWRQLGLQELMRKLLPKGKALIEPADVVASLVIHRCVDPGSKLAATRWFPRTALPELLDVPPTALENTRLHTVLNLLDGVTSDLMRQLPARYLHADSAFTTLFMDVTDAWFVGQGPTQAKYGRTKEDLIRRMIGILLVCNEHGYPLRWQVLAGNHAESTAMLEQYRALEQVRWAKQVPVVVDRALGRTSHLQQLLETGVCFVTALVRPEIPNYVEELPKVGLTQRQLRDKRADQVKALGETLATAGFSKLDDTLYLRDLGVVEHNTAPPSTIPEDDAIDDRCGFALRSARSIRKLVDSGAAPSQAAALRQFGLGKGAYHGYRKLEALTEPLQMAVLEGQARGVALSQLRNVSKLPAHEQPNAFADLIARNPTARERRPTFNAPKPPLGSNSPVRLRAVAYFNPEIFLDQRDKARKKLKRVEDAVHELNEQLASSRSRRKRDAVAAAADRILRKESLLDVYEVTIERSNASGRDVFHVALTLRNLQWERRRRLDGFSVLVTRPDLDITARELCRVYRQKDTVETDFRIIKSCVKLRPIWHHNDNKVRAHVTLCLLALLLQRALRRMLGDVMSAEAAKEHLADCPLNRYAANGESAYLITRPDPSQLTILETLGMAHLADDDSMFEMIHPR